jgi:hypothetical protein
VEARGDVLVGHLHLGSDPVELGDGARFGGAHVRRRQHAEWSAALAVACQVVPELEEAGPFDERHDEIDPVGRLDLAADFRKDANLLGVYEEVRASKRGCRPPRDNGGLGQGSASSDVKKELASQAGFSPSEGGRRALLQDAQQVVRKREPLGLCVLPTDGVEGNSRRLVDGVREVLDGVTPRQGCPSDFRAGREQIQIGRQGIRDDVLVEAVGKLGAGSLPVVAEAEPEEGHDAESISRADAGS